MFSKLIFFKKITMYNIKITINKKLIYFVKLYLLYHSVCICVVLIFIEYKEMHDYS